MTPPPTPSDETRTTGAAADDFRRTRKRSILMPSADSFPSGDTSFHRLQATGALIGHLVTSNITRVSLRTRCIRTARLRHAIVT